MAVGPTRRERRAGGVSGKVSEASWEVQRRDWTTGQWTVERREWGGLRDFQGRALVGKEAEALEVTGGWGEMERTAWADDSRREVGGVGAAVVWRQRAHTPRP